MLRDMLLKTIRTLDPDQNLGYIAESCQVTVPAVPTQEAIPEEGG